MMALRFWAAEGQAGTASQKQVSVRLGGSMAYLYRAANDAAAPSGGHYDLAQNKWPLRSTVWLVLAFGSFAWIAIIFGCITLL
jgi:hypothetical protein